MVFKADTSLTPAKHFDLDNFLENLNEKEPLQSGNSKVDTFLELTLFPGPTKIIPSKFTPVKWTVKINQTKIKTFFTKI